MIRARSWEIRGALVSWAFHRLCHRLCIQKYTPVYHSAVEQPNTYNSSGFLRLHVALHAFCTHRLWLPNHHFTANSMSCICPSSFCVACNCIFTSPNHHYKIIFRFVLLTIGNHNLATTCSFTWYVGHGQFLNYQAIYDCPAVLVGEANTLV